MALLRFHKSSSKGAIRYFEERASKPDERAPSSSTQYELASKKLVALEQSFIIQHETNKQLALQISELHNEIVGLNRELNFYQNITQGTGSSELQIRDFYLSPAPLG